MYTEKRPNRLKQSLSIATSTLFIFQPVFPGGIEVDNAGTNQHTSIDTSANGTPVVNITGPNSNGVSHNTYINFNVPTQGTILNNSGQEVETQLAGYIYGNENVKNGSASLILNEVSGTNRSDMNGYVEVAGKSADVIIANPNGITVNGGGFINTPKATLTTGKVGFDGVNPTYDVDGGDIRIEGSGLDASQTDALEIYTQSMKLNAKLHADRLDVVTGRNTIDKNGKVTKKSDNGSQGFGIDSTALGGIYAGAITLRGTETGVGVNIPDEILAQDQLQITADGKITLGSVLVENKATLKSQSGSVEIDEGLHASSLIIDAKDTITIDGDVGASGDIALSGSSLSNHATLAAGVNKDFSTAQEGDLDLEFTEKITNEGIVYALDSLNADTGYLVNRENGYLIANVLSIDSLTGIENAGEFTAGDMLLHTEALTNSGMVYAKGSLDISTDTLRNLSGTMIAEERLTAMVSEDISNVDGTLYSAKGTTISAKNLDNEEGFIGSAQKVFLDLLGLSGNNGTVSGKGIMIQADTMHANNATIQSTDRLDIAASGDVVLSASTLLANGLLNLTSKDIKLNDTTLYSVDDDITLKTHTLDAVDTNMEAGQTLAVTSDHLYTDSSHFFAGDHLEVTSSINTIDAGTKFLSSSTMNLTFDTDSLTHYGEIAANGEVRIAVEGDLYNESTITAGGSLYLGAETLYNNANDTNAKIKGGGDSTIVLSGNLDNYGFLSSSGSLSVTAGNITNYAGIAAAETLTLDGTNLINYHTLYSGKDMNLYLSHLLRNNENAAIYAGGDLTIAKDAKGGKTQKIENLVAKIESQGDMNISAKSLLNQGKTKLASISTYYNLITESNMTAAEYEQWKEDNDGRKVWEEWHGYDLDDVWAWIVNNGLRDVFIEQYGDTYYKPEEVITINANYSFTLKEGIKKNSGTTSWLEIEERIEDKSTTTHAIITAGNNSSLEIDSVINKDATISVVNDLYINTGTGTLENTPIQKTVNTMKTERNLHWWTDYDLTSDNETYLDYTFTETISGSSLIGGISQIIVGGKVSGNVDTLQNGIEEGVSVDRPTETERISTATQSTEENQSPVDGTGSAVIPETLTDQENSIGTPQVYDPAAQQIVLPDNPYGIYVTNPDPEGPLIESNPEYTNYNNFVSSDYMLDRLEYDAENQVRRLGDAMYETQLVRDAVIAMTGQRYIGNTKSDNEQYIYLMENGLNYAEEVGLELGNAPTKEQLENLKEDLVWLEFRVVEGKRVLVPVLYLAREYKKPDGAHIHAESMDMTIDGYLGNSGSIKTKTDMTLRTGRMANVKGTIEAGTDLKMGAIGDIQNLSGSIKGSSVVLASTQGNIVNKTLSQDLSAQNRFGTKQYTLVDETATIEATKGGMKLDAAKNIENTGADLASKNGMTLKAEEDLNIKTIKEEDSYDYRFKNGYATGESVTHIQSNVKTEGLLDIQTGGDANLEAVKIKAADTRIAAESRVNLTAVVDSKYDESYLKQSGFLSESASTDVTLSQSVKGTTIDTGIVQIEGKEGTGVESARITASQAAHITSQNSNVDFTAKSYTNAEYHETRESILGGLYKERSVESISETKLADSATRAESSIIVGGKNVNLVATELETNNGGIKLTATDNVNIVSGMEAHSETHIKEKSGLFQGGHLYQAKTDDVAAYDESAKASSVVAGSNGSGSVVIEAGSAEVIGSNIEASNHIVTTTDVGSIEIKEAKEEHGLKEVHEELNIDLSFDHSVENGKVKVTVASAEYDKSGLDERSTTSAASSLKAGGTVQLTSIEDIKVQGSDIAANGNVILDAAGDVLITEAKDTTESTLDELHAEAEVSVTVSHTAVDAGYAVKAVDDAKDQLQLAERDYRQYQKDLNKQEEQLSLLKEEYAQGQLGVTQEDIDELSELIADSKEDEKYYLANIATASANFASKTTQAAQATAAAAQSTGTAGFAASLDLDVDGTKTNTQTQSTVSRGSTITAGNTIGISTGKGEDQETLIQGSHLAAGNTINVDTANLNIVASEDTSHMKQESEHINAHASASTAGGWSVSVSGDKSNSQQTQITHTNSTLQANTVHLMSTEDTTIAGANIHGTETTTLNVGGDLNIASVQDKSKSGNHNIGASIGISGSTGLDNPMTDADESGASGVSGANGGVNTANGRSQSRQTVLTTVTGGEVTIETNGNTDLKGAFVAAGSIDKEGSFVDNGQLTLITRTFTHSDLSNTSYSSNTAVSVNTNMGINNQPANPTDLTSTSQNDVKINSSQIKANSSQAYTKTKTLATLGEGSVTVGGVETTTDSTLNRDTANIDKEIYDVKQQQANIDLTVDHRLLSEDGRKDISEDVQRTKRLGQAIGDVVVEDSKVLKGSDVLNHIDDVQKDLTVQKQLALSDNGKMVDILENQENYTQVEIDKALNNYAKIYAKVYGISISNAKQVLMADKYGSTYTNVCKTDSIVYVDANKNNGVYSTSKTLGHEVAESRQRQGQTRQREGVAKERYSDIFGDYSSEGLEFSSNNWNSVKLNTNKKDELKVISGSDFKKLQTNTQEYYQDKAKADSKNGYLDDKIYHVPGTFANANNVDKSFTEGLKEYYNDEKLEVIEHQDRHPLQNNHKDREKLADRLAKKIIEDYKKNPDEPIRLIGHSHGGNVQKIVTQKLVEKGYEGIVDDIMYMGTPVIDDYKTANKVLKKDAEVINVYDKTDNVQPKGGNNGSNPLIKKAVKGEYGDAGQTIDDNPRVTNLEVVSPTIFDTAKVTNNGYEVPWIIEQYEGYESHINIDSPEVIYQMKENRRKNKD